MARFEKEYRPRRKYKPQHQTPKDFHLDYILLPSGANYNTQWEKAKGGDMVYFVDGGSGEVVSVRKIRVDQAETDLLSWIRYGISIKRCLQIWSDIAVLEGNGRNAISDMYCYWVVFNKNYETDD